MQFYSLNGAAQMAGFREATLRGQAPDKGLYFPERIPRIPAHVLEHPEELSNTQMAFELIRPYAEPDIPEEILYNIVSETISFDIPLVRINENIFSLELYHGPTLAFKDVGARFMSRCLGYFAGEGATRITVLVATSGDTGGAVANGFFQVPEVEVVILFPSGKVSPVQEKQLTSLGHNIHALEIDGNFDDCQRLVKTAFMDPDLHRSRLLTSANSINVARWLPQQFYYLFAWKQWKEKDAPPVFCVPSGNFGNICAGLLAYASGMPARGFIAACNENDVVTRYLETGQYQPVAAHATLSNAMDVGDPSNFIRVMELFHQQLGDLRKILTSYSISDTQTLKTIESVYHQHQYLLDPHGAVGYAALEKYLLIHADSSGIVLETAHPVKFPSQIESITGGPIPAPPGIIELLNHAGHSTKMKADFETLKQFLLELKKGS